MIATCAALVRSCGPCEGPGCVWLVMLGGVGLVVMLLLTWGADTLRWCEARGLRRLYFVLLIGMALASVGAVGALVTIGLGMLP